MRQENLFSSLVLMFLICLFAGACSRRPEPEDEIQALRRKHTEYRNSLRLFHQEFPARATLPEGGFYLFGMGPRIKMVYQHGVLKEAFSGKAIRKWDVVSDEIIPSEYTVLLETSDGRTVVISENETGIRIKEGDSRVTVSKGRVSLPDFQGKRYAPVLRVLHQEMLVNIFNGCPLPNYFVYKKAWYRDGAMVCMCLEKTGNLHLVKDWILGLSEPYDRNNAGNEEPDNLGQALYMISLVSDTTHPLAAKILAEIPEIRVGNFIDGITDGSLHPVYATKWLKFGLKNLGLADPYEIPRIEDSYSSLFWMDYRRDGLEDTSGSRPDLLYPYLGWARAHFIGDKGGGIVGNLEYPLTWETQASQADYQGMSPVSESYVAAKTAAPHTWHSAEIFLYLLDF
ncbi:MAG TPA: hypothetical protein VM123_02865 [archaeon]|nr:hypothetical protein [archaeon]